MSYPKRFTLNRSKPIFCLLSMDSILRLYESKTGLSNNKPSDGAFGILILVDSNVFGMRDSGVSVRTHNMAMANNCQIVYLYNNKESLHIILRI